MLERQREENQVTQNAAPEIGYMKPPPQTKGVARLVAEETGLSVDTVRRALNPKPKVVDIKSAIEPESDHDAIIREANAIVSAWNRQPVEHNHVGNVHALWTLTPTRGFMFTDCSEMTKVRRWRVGPSDRDSFAKSVLKARS